MTDVKARIRTGRPALVPAPAVRWRTVREPRFDNQSGWIHIDGRLSVSFERARPAEELEPDLEHRVAQGVRDGSARRGR